MLPPMADSITKTFAKLAAVPDAEQCELACEQLHGICVTLMWIAAGIRKHGYRGY